MKGGLNLEFNEDELKLIKGCLLTTKEAFKMTPLKNQTIKNKIIEIENLLKKFN